jgi:hypothetical protein
MTHAARPDLPLADRIVGKLFFAAAEWLLGRAQKRSDTHEEAHCLAAIAVANSTHGEGEACTLPVIWPMLLAGFAPKPENLTDIVDRPSTP